MAAVSIEAALRRHRFRFASERALQNSLTRLLEMLGFAATREYRLGPEDVADFFLEGSGLAIEVKVDGSLSAVTRQLHRYAGHHDVNALMLITSLNRHDSLPNEMQGKPLRVVVLPGGLA